MIYILVLYIVESAMQVAKWGNSLAVRLPKAVVEALELAEGDEVQIHVTAPAEFEVSRRPSFEEVWERIRKLNITLPPDWKFDREEANAR